MTMPIDVSVIVPTYRERENLALLVPRLFAILDRSGLSYEVIIVDDDSGDGTDTWCRQFGSAEKLWLVIRRGERGLASAVLRGFELARGAVCVVMDADLSHPPEKVPALVAAVQAPGCDMAIGSRYVSGGAVDERWSWFRRLNSRVATLLARGLTATADPLAGFFAVKKSTVARAGCLRPLGYKIALELIVRCNCRQVTEVPIKFHDRTTGQSKLSLRQQWLYLWQLRQLYATRLTVLLLRRGTKALTDDKIRVSRRRAA